MSASAILPGSPPSAAIDATYNAGYDASWDAPRSRRPDEPPEPDSAWNAWSRSVDHVTIWACLGLFAIGVILAFASSPALAKKNDLSSFYYAWRHLLFGAPAFLALLALSFLSPRGVRRFGALLALAGLVALALLPFYGESFGKGAVRWFSVGGVSFQPSEFLKPGLIVACGWMLSALESRDRNVAQAGAGFSFAFVAFAVLLLVMQPDYGQAALIAAVWTTMFFVSGASPVLLIALAAAVAGIGVAGYSIEPHIAARIEAFLDPSVAAGEQIRTAAEAIMHGGWFGVGMGEGVVKAKLPDAHTDFIIAVGAEEIGVGLPVLIIALFAVIVVRALWRLRKAEEMFVRLAGVGLALLLGAQAFVNLAVAVQLLPAKGMTLPFISYGGSSMIATGITVGLLLALTRRKPDDLMAAIGRKSV